MNDRLLIGTRRESSAMKAGNFRFREGKRKTGSELRAGKATLWRGVFFFCRFIGLERRALHDNGLCGLARCFPLRKVPQTKDYPFCDGKAQERKKCDWKTGKTRKGCRDKHQGNLFERDGARKVSMQSKLRVTARANVFRLYLPALRTLSGMEPAGVLEGVREVGTDLYR